MALCAAPVDPVCGPAGSRPRGMSQSSNMVVRFQTGIQEYKTRDCPACAAVHHHSRAPPRLPLRPHGGQSMLRNATAGRLRGRPVGARTAYVADVRTMQCDTMRFVSMTTHGQIRRWRFSSANGEGSRSVGCRSEEARSPFSAAERTTGQGRRRRGCAERRRSRNAEEKVM